MSDANEGNSPPFEPTNSWAYRFSRYTAIPEILLAPEVASGAPFRLIEQTRRVMSNHLTEEQQQSTYIRAQSGKVSTISKAIRWYIPFIAKKTGQLVGEGEGIYRLPREDDFDEDELAEEALEESADEVEEDETDLSGWIYAFTFPLIRKPEGNYPIKVGMTLNDVERRVTSQCRSSAAFEQPVVVARWSVNNMGAAERAIHNVLKYRGRWRKDAPGKEWFDTHPNELGRIIEFLDGDQN